MTELTARDAFIAALDERDLMIKVMEREPESMDQAYKIAERLELYKQIPGAPEPELKSKTSTKVRSTSAADDGLLQTLLESQKSMLETQKNPQKQIAALTETMKKSNALPSKSDGSVKIPTGKPKGACHHCQKPGHYRPECPEWLAQHSEAKAENPTTRSVTSRDNSIDKANATAASRKKYAASRPVGPENIKVAPLYCFTDGDMTLNETGLPDVTKMTHAVWLDFIRRTPPPVTPTPPAPPMLPERRMVPTCLNLDDAVCLVSALAGEAVQEEVCSIGNPFYVEVSIGKGRYSALLDTGSEVTLIPERLAKATQLRLSSCKLRAANGTEINLAGEWRTNMKIETLNLPVTFLASDQIDEVLIGVDWMRTNQCLLSFVDFTISVRGRRFPLLQRSVKNTCHRVVLDSDVEVPARSEMTVSGRVVFANLRDKWSNTWVAESADCAPGV